MKQFELPLLHAGEIACLQSPPNIHASPHGSGIAARRINQDAMEWRHRSDLQRGAPACPVVTESADDLDAEPRHILFQDLEALRVAIACDDCSPVFHQLRNVTCFPTRSGACIENLFSRFRIQNLTGNRGAWILNVAVASTDSGCRYDVKFNELGIEHQRPGLWIKSEERFGVDS